MVGVDLEVLLRSHVTHRRRVTKSLSLHDALHVRRPSVFRGDNAARRVHKSVRDGHLLHLLLEDVLDDLAEVLELDLKQMMLTLHSLKE